MQEITFPETDPDRVASQRAPFAAALAQAQKAFPGTLGYESRDSADLVANMSSLGPNFTDDDVAKLKPIAGQIVEADFSNTAITDRSALALAAMKQLRVLRLMHTRLTDRTVDALTPLDQLRSLNVYGTGVTSAALLAAKRMPRLEHLYVGETKISENTSMDESIKHKVVF